MTEIDREHPEFKHQKRMWHTYRDLYRGGQEFQYRAADYLLRRQKEPLDVYGERLQRVFYENYIGSIVDWYASTLFRREPSIQVDSGRASGQKFLAAFAEDCDLRGTKLSSFFRHSLIDALVNGRTHMLLDFPRNSARVANRAEEDAAGLSRAYLVHCQPEDVINWSKDERGDYEWIVLRQTVRRQPRVDSAEIVTETCWHYYDRERYRTFRRVGTDQQPGTIQLIGEGPHALVRQRRVPLFTLQVSEG
jgi:hypothetical protein